MNNRGRLFRGRAKLVYMYPALLSFLYLLLLPVYALAADSLCATVKIEINQELTLERQAFEAHMRINNGLTNISLQNVNISVNFSDKDGNVVTATTDSNNTSALFFIKVDSMTNINAVNGTGTVAASTAADIYWLIIPATGAANGVPQGKLYYVGATLSYTLGGEQRVINVSPDFIYVKPMPELTLDYFLPTDVYGDDPFTQEIEPVVPFSLGVRVKNSGQGVANKVKIESAQPKIVENKQGLLINFTITGSEVNGSAATKSLLVDFGNIQPNASGVARWIMTCTLSGKFTEFTASYTHSDELGGELTSLIDAVNTHFLVHDVLVDVSGRDNIRDFLACDAGQYKVYESENVDTSVADQSGSSSLQFVGQSGTEATYNLSTAAATGFIYIKLSDPYNGAKIIKEVIRSDGKTLKSDNAWLSKTRDGNNNWLYYFNLFDANPTGSYTVKFDNSAQTTQPPVLQFIPDRTGKEGVQTGFLVEASNADGTKPALSAASLPAMAKFTDNNNGTGIFNWTPAVGQAGSYPITFTAASGSLKTSQTATLTINAAVYSTTAAYWKFDENIGSIAHDETPYHNDGTLEGNTIWTAGKSGSALSFNGHGDYVAVGSNESLNITSHLTIEAWVNPTTDNLGAIVDMAQEGTSTENYALLIGPGTTFPAFHFQYNDGSRFRQFTIDNFYTLNTWQQVAVVYSAGTITAYKDGLQVSQITSMPPLVANPANTLKVGRYQVGDRGWFAGKLDELAIYKRVLYNDEIARHYGTWFKSAVDNNASGGAGGAKAGDQVVITFSYKTQGNAITASNINSALQLSNGHTWTDSSQHIGNAVWSTAIYSNDTLTVTLSDTSGAPTLSRGDSLTLGGIIKDNNGQPVTGSVDITFSQCLKTIWYQDADGDSYGNSQIFTWACSAPAGYVGNNADCDDTNRDINPNTVWYKDANGDGYSDGAKLVQCDRPDSSYYLASQLIAVSGDYCDDVNISSDPRSNTTIYVNATNTGNGDGSQVNPYKTIQQAIDAAGCGDTILVNTGVYTENIHFLHKSLRVMGSGADTIIDGYGRGPAVTFDSGENRHTILDGFTIRNGTGADIGNGLTAGGGIWVSNGSSPLIVNNIIYSNQATYGGGISCSGSSPAILNNTIADNLATFGGGVSAIYDSFPQITNTIIWSNANSSIFLYSSAITVTYSDIESGYIGSGNINVNPQFKDAAQRDYHLQYISPCINTGIASRASVMDIDGISRPHGPGYDMGAYEMPKGIPAVTWNNPADIVYGTALNGTQLNATASVPGTFTYMPVSGTMLNAGNSQTLHVDFVPDDTNIYTGVSAEVTINVSQADAAINISGYIGYYDGNTHGAAGLATGVNNEDLSSLLNLGAVFTSVPGSTAFWTFNADNSNPNYKSASGNVAIAINPKTASVTPNAVSKTYGDSDPALTGTPTGFLTGDNVTASYSRIAGEAAGTYTISASLSPTGVLGNYNITYNTANFTINPKAITVTADAKSKTYGNTDPALTYQITSGSLVGGDTFTGSLTRTAGENVGTYAIQQGTLALNSNYALTYIGANLTINKKDASVTPNSASKTYGDADPALTGTLTGFLSGDNVSAAYSRTAGEAAGTYTISATLSPASVLGNYSITYNSANFTINKRALTVTADAKSKTYGAADPALTYQVTSGSLVSGDSFTGNLTRAIGEGVGNYSILQGTLTLNSNYTLNYVGNILTINKQDASVTPNSASKIYGDTDPILTGTLTGFLVADGVTATYTRPAGETVAGGPYTISATLSPTGVLGNYNITYNTANFTINKRSITVTVDAKNKTYGDADPALTYTYNPAPVNGDAFTGNLARTAGENAGTYAIQQGTLVLNGNYNLTYIVADLTITPKAASVTPNAASKIYGDTEPVLTGILTGFLAGDNVTASYSRTAGETAGTYTISVTLSPANVLGNYSIIYNTASFTINKKTITVTADIQAKVYGNFDPILTYTHSPALIGSDTFTGNLSRITGENVGAYAIQQGTLALNSNYTLTYVSANLTISPKSITVTADAKSKIYGDSDPALTYTYTPALVSGDTFTGALTHAVGENVGTYVIGQGALALNANYTLTYIGANLTINKKDASVTPNAASKTYGNTDPVLTGTLIGFLAGDNVTAAYSRTVGETAGAYIINATLNPVSVLSNYNITYNTANFTINQADAIITVNGYTGYYDGNSHGASGSATGVNNANLSSLLNLGAAFTNVPGGAAHWTFNAGHSNPDYKSASGEVMITINKATPTITWSNPEDIVYGTALTGIQLNATASVPGTFTYTPAAGTTLNAGTGQTLHVEFTPTDTTNYNSASANVMINVAKANQTITFAALADKTYGDPDFYVSATASSGLAVTFTTTGNCTISGTTVHITGAGSGTLTVHQSGNSNYNAAPDISQTFNIAKAAPAITWNNPADIVYGTALSGTQLNATASVAGVFTYIPTAGTVLNAGNGQTLSVTFAPDNTADYNPASASVTINVMQKAITVTADAKSKTYGDSDPALTYAYTPALVGGDTFIGNLTRNAGESVGTYAIGQGNLALNGNYSVAYIGANLAISKRNASVTPNSASKTYGDIDPVLSGTLSGFLIGDNVTATYSCTAGNNAGTYTISATLSPVVVLGNYSITYNTANFTINPKPITITADAKSKIYGESDPVLTYTYTPALVSGDSFIGNLTRAAGENVGAYAIGQGTLALNTNYTLTYVGANLTISKATLVIAWSNPADIVYGTALNATQLNATASVAGTFVYSPAAGAILNAGNGQTLSVTFTPNDIGNYDGVSKSVTINVQKAIATVTLSNLTQTYSNASLSPTVTTNPAGLGYSLTGAPDIAAGSYAVKATVNDSNYIGSASGIFTINKATPSITWSNPADIIYGTALSGTQLNAAASVLGTFIYTPAAGTVPNIGCNQTLHVNFTPTDGANYNSVSANVIINVVAVWYKDADNDGYTDGTTITACTQPSGYKLAGELNSITSLDCNDNDPTFHPGAADVCENGVAVDKNCDGKIDINPYNLITQIKSAINNLNCSEFKNSCANRKNALSQKLDALSKIISSALSSTNPSERNMLLQDAKDKLNNDIMAKMDGCSGGNSNDDWISGCAGQSAVYPMGQCLYHDLEALKL